MNDKQKPNSSARIRELNDALRRNFGIAPHLVARRFKVLITPGAGSLDEQCLAGLLAKVASFDVFTASNDPYGEHDFGAVEHEGTRYFWKIDYYDLQMRMASPQPSNPNVTIRLLTIMRADEY